jgi:hypothetical protein
VHTTGGEYDTAGIGYYANEDESYVLVPVASAPNFLWDLIRTSDGEIVYTGGSNGMHPWNAGPWGGNDDPPTVVQAVEGELCGLCEVTACPVDIEVFVDGVLLNTVTGVDPCVDNTVNINWN